MTAARSRIWAAALAVQFRWAVAAFTAFLLALLWGGIVLQLDYDRAQSVDRARVNVINLSHAFEEHIASVFRAVDQTLIELKYDYERDPAGFDPATALSQHVALRGISLQVSTIDPAGYLSSSSEGTPSKPIYIGDREHFTVHAGSDVGAAFISKPVLGRVSGRWSIQVSRRLNHADGSFAGVMVISLDPQHLANFFNQIDLGNDGFISVVGREDMVTRARTSASGPNPPARNLMGTKLPEMLVKSSYGTYETVSPVDGVYRIVAYRALSEYPLVVVVGMSRSDVLASFVRRAIWLICGSAAVSLIFLCAAHLLIRQNSRRMRTEGMLRSQSAELRKRRDEADFASRAKSQFLANMSHELRTPLNAIIGFSDLIQRGIYGPIGSLKYLDYVRDIHRSGEHLLGVINGVLDMSKIEAGHYDIRLTDVDLGRVSSACARLVSVDAERAAVSLTIDVGTTLPCVRADQQALKQILLNILSNAIKFTPKGGRVTMTAIHATNSRIVIEIADSGIGIAKEDIERVFQPFQQAEETLSRAYGGTGLGLAITKKLVELNQGTIAIQSQAGAGTTVIVEFPAGRAGAVPHYAAVAEMELDFVEMAEAEPAPAAESRGNHGARAV